MTRRKCSIKNCVRSSHGHGWCNMHHQRWLRHGDPLFSSRGGTTEFLARALATETDACIVWPYYKNEGGYAKMKSARKVTFISRLVCKNAYGRPPSSKHEAAHSCGNPPCINKRHLRWATPRENQADRVAHGTTNRGTRNGNAKLNECDVLNIRNEYAKGGISYEALGKFFAVSKNVISCAVRRKTWPHVAGLPDVDARAA